jgi:hypothetical protein
MLLRMMREEKVANADRKFNFGLLKRPPIEAAFGIA